MQSASTTPSVPPALPGAAGHAGTVGAALWRWLISWQALAYGLAAFVVFVALSVVAARSVGNVTSGENLWAWAISGGWLDALSASAGQALHFGLRASAAFLGLVCSGRLVALWVPGWSLPPYGAQLVGESTWAEASAVEARGTPLLAAAGLRWTSLLRDGQVRAAVIRDASPLRQIAGFAWLGALVMLAALTIQVRLGWVGEPLELSLGDVRLLGDARATRVRLDEIVVVPRADGSPGHLAGSLTLVRGDEQVAAVSMSPGQIRFAAGLTLSCLGSGPAVRVEVTRPDGTPLAVRTLGQGPARPGPLRVRFPTAEQEQLVLAAEADRLLSLVLYTAETAEGAAPEVRVQYREASSGSVLDEAVLGNEATLRDAQATVRLAREYYLRVRAATQPGLMPSAIGGALLLVGMFGGAVWPPRRAWIVCEEGDGPVRAELWCRRRDVGRPWLRAVAGAWPPEDA